MVKSTTLAPNEWRMVMADCRSEVRWSFQAGSPMCTQRPPSRWSAISQRPRPRATTWGRCPAMRNGHRPRQLSQPGVAGPTAPEMNTWSCGSRSQPSGVVGHVDAVLAARRPPRAPCPASWRWSRRGPGAAPDGCRRRRRAPARRAPTRVKPGGRGKTTRGPPEASARATDAAPEADGARAGRPRHGEREAPKHAAPNRPRTPQRVTPAPSSRAFHPRPGRAGHA